MNKTPVFDPFDVPETPQKPKQDLMSLDGNLNDLNLDKELFEQYARAKNLLNMAEFDDEVQLNQKVQAMNSVVSILGQIVKLQENLYNVKQLVKLESTLINTLKAHPTLRDAFLTDYKVACAS